MVTKDFQGFWMSVKKKAGHCLQKVKMWNSNQHSQEWLPHRNSAFRMSQKNLEQHLKVLEAPFASVKVSVYDSAPRKILGKNCINGGVLRKPLLTKTNTMASLTFPQKTSRWSIGLLGKYSVEQGFHSFKCFIIFSFYLVLTWGVQFYFIFNLFLPYVR